MRTYTLLFSIAVHVAAVAALLVAPIFASDLPDPLQMRQVTFFDVVAPPPPPPPPPAPVARREEVAAQRADVAPLAPPPAVVAETAVDPPSDPGAIAERFVALDSVIGGGAPGFIAPPPPSPPPGAPVRVGGAIRMPEKVVHVAPVYPRVAIEAHIEGLVILEAVLDEHGAVRAVRVLRSAPLLDRAAVDAVRQWRYTPTLLNGVPVPVVITVTVSFNLAK